MAASSVVGRVRRGSRRAWIYLRWLGPVTEGRPPTPFTRLSTVHWISAAGDAFMPVALAGSLFFSISLKAAQSRVALALLLTVAPFAVVGPLIGPFVDRLRGGRRSVVVVSAVGRAFAVYFMAEYVHSLLLFPWALVALVCSKGYSVAKAALVPGVVDDPARLVEANSKLAIGSSVSGALAALPAVGILKLFGGAAVLRIDIIIYIVLVVFALRLDPAPTHLPNEAAEGQDTAGDDGVAAPETAGHADAAGAAPPEATAPTGAPSPTRYPPPPVTDLTPPGSSLWGDHHPPRVLPPGALLRAWIAMASLRMVVGLLAFMVVFSFRRDGAPLIWYGIVGLSNVLGNLGGAAIAPQLRLRFGEERILAGTTLIVGVVGAVVSQMDVHHRWPAALIFAGVLGLGANAAKLAFDSLVQQYVEPSRRPRVFGRTETTFQLVWVVGSLIPVLATVGLLLGMSLSAAIVLGAFVLLVAGHRRNDNTGWMPGGDVRSSRPARSAGRAS